MREPNPMRRAVTVVALVLWIAGAALAAPPEGGSPTSGPSAPVDLNSASEDELISIPGIGKVTARRIVEWRDEHGPFRRVEDLMKVKGIGEKSFQKLRPYVKVSKSKSG